MMKKRHAHKSNVLLVNITRLGDMLQATPTIAGMKMENPDCKVTVVVEKQFEGVCGLIPNIDEVISIDLSMTVRSLARQGDGIIDAYEYVSEFVDDLRDRSFDYCLNMSSSAYTAMLLNAIGIERNGGWTSDDEGYRVISSDWARLFASSVFHQNRQFNSLNLVDVFRCSADVEQHPQHLLIDVDDQELQFADQMVRDANFSNDGPLIVVQAGASQEKRQWSPDNFVNFIKILVNQHNARVVLTGTKKELSIVEPIKEGCQSENVFVAAGKTNIPQLAAMIKRSEVLITGDTGPMHIAAAVGTPSVSMFLASAYGFETGPYSEGNIVLQPVIGCGPCNPNKPCLRPDCHDNIPPELLAQLTMMRVQGDVTELPKDMIDPSQLIVYRTFFDEFGFYDMQPLSSDQFDWRKSYREAYRKVWLADLAGYDVSNYRNSNAATALKMAPPSLEGIGDAVSCAQEGKRLLGELSNYIKDVSVAPQKLGQVNDQISELDRHIEQIGYHYAHLGPATRMFVFAKENLSGTDALQLASQMTGIYADLERRCQQLGSFYR